MKRDYVTSSLNPTPGERAAKVIPQGEGCPVTQAGVSHALDDQVCSILVIDDVPKPARGGFQGSHKHYRVLEGSYWSCL